MISLLHAHGPLTKWKIFLPSAALLSGIFAAADDISLEYWISAALERDPTVAEARAETSWEHSRMDTREVWEDPELRIGRERREDRDGWALPDRAGRGVERDAALAGSHRTPPHDNPRWRGDHRLAVPAPNVVSPHLPARRDGGSLCHLRPARAAPVF